MNFIERLIEVIAPHICLGCGREGRLLCAACRHALPQPVRCCYRCRAVDAAGRVCRSCRSSSPLRSVYAAARYESVAKQLVWSLKFERAQAAAAELTNLIAASGYKPPRNCLFVPLPTASTRVRQRGYDQAKLLARCLSRHYGLPCKNLLYRVGSHQQHGASRLVRQQQLRHAFIPQPGVVATDYRIVLVDDVVTTGASLEAASRVLRSAGFRSIDAVVFAQA